MTTSCPHCGAEIAEEAKFCRHCGSSDSDGWRDDSYDGEIDDFDYDEFVAENFSGRVTNTGTRPLWRLVAIIVLLAFLLGTLALFQ